MSKLKRGAVGVAALLIPATLLMTGASVGAATRFARSYSAPYNSVSSHLVDTGRRGLSIGDQDIGAVRLYKSGMQRGVMYYDCAFTIVRHDRVRQLCQTDTDIYSHGQIIAAGIGHSSSSFHQPIAGGSYVLHITGGSGDYRGHPRGTVTVKFRAHGASIIYRVKR